MSQENIVQLDAFRKAVAVEDTVKSDKPEEGTASEIKLNRDNLPSGAIRNFIIPPKQKEPLPTFNSESFHNQILVTQQSPHTESSGVNDVRFNQPLSEGPAENTPADLARQKEEALAEEFAKSLAPKPKGDRPYSFGPSGFGSDGKPKKKSILEKILKG